MQGVESKIDDRQFEELLKKTELSLQLANSSIDRPIDPPFTIDSDISASPLCRFNDRLLTFDECRVETESSLMTKMKNYRHIKKILFVGLVLSLLLLYLIYKRLSKRN